MSALTFEQRLERLEKSMKESEERKRPTSKDEIMRRMKEIDRLVATLSLERNDLWTKWYTIKNEEDKKGGGTTLIVTPDQNNKPAFLRKIMD